MIQFWLLVHDRSIGRTDWTDGLDGRTGRTGRPVHGGFRMPQSSWTYPVHGRTDEFGTLPVTPFGGGGGTRRRCHWATRLFF
jgi:hypothetical protein